MWCTPTTTYSAQVKNWTIAHRSLDTKGAHQKRKEHSTLSALRLSSPSMWRACRVAALRQLRIEAARVPVARAPLALQQLGGVNSYFTSIAGVDREVLLTRSTRDLRQELGDAQSAWCQGAQGRVGRRYSARGCDQRRDHRLIHGGAEDARHLRHGRRLQLPGCQLSDTHQLCSVRRDIPHPNAQEQRQAPHRDLRVSQATFPGGARDYLPLRYCWVSAEQRHGHSRRNLAGNDRCWSRDDQRDHVETHDGICPQGGRREGAGAVQLGGPSDRLLARVVH
ncbi:hypothetical protein GQ600_4106 [Phytophthora cactorum]|nr:hypothetical protein GQ600_4106 [Phytophthora cactorum]